MNFQTKPAFTRVFAVCLFIVAFAAMVAAQRPQPTPTMLMEAPRKPFQIAGSNDLYSAGYIQTNGISTTNKIIGAQDEADKYNYTQGDFLYINIGANKGVNIGDTFAVVRPRGQFSSKWSRKGGLGFYVQEVGSLEVVNVKAEVSVARIKSSCDTFLLGDLVELVPQRTSPTYEYRPPLNRFGDPSGKASGRIVLGRDSAEMFGTDSIVYVDLGADDNVHIGDHLTVYRPLGKGNLRKGPDDEPFTARDYGFDSDTYHNGKFSSEAGRKSGEKATGQVVTTARAKKGRPEGLRKVVGEAVVLNVKQKTATVVITRTGQEIHTGDFVEIQ